MEVPGVGRQLRGEDPGLAEAPDAVPGGLAHEIPEPQAAIGAAFSSSVSLALLRL